ncbi:MAG: hypothetical protein R2810_02420 [Flavobacteriales bacterium]|nr:hypothetical protein [Flavobacteriales bacterium]MCB0813356.1 hypothetical protein [Flavobacteriales bacterium]MCB9182204.1 hypothetical protein [Flavobacteriales bacterium]MCB9200700.1 hypothetical protein [Flavobacteriales bacterium]HOP43018.1 hypothetical protein [Flavobacteriales bacterium]
MRTSRWLLLSFLSAGIMACGGPEPPQKDTLSTEDSGDGSVQQVRQKKTKAIFYSIPSPMETATLLKKAGAEYETGLLNDVEKVNTYTSASKQALNLGIYGADLSYASVYDHTQESMFYTSCARNLADKLGVLSAFNDTIMDRLERNKGERDSLLTIISGIYWNVDAYLKENGRDNIAALMMAGGWIEGLYLATQVTATNDTPELRQRIAEQKHALDDLLALMNTYEDAGEGQLASTMADLNALAELYKDVDLGESGTVTQENGVTVLAGGKAATLNDEQLTAIRERAATIRNNYVN